MDADPPRDSGSRLTAILYTSGALPSLISKYRRIAFDGVSIVTCAPGSNVGSSAPSKGASVNSQIYSVNGRRASTRMVRSVMNHLLQALPPNPASYGSWAPENIYLDC